MGPDVSLALQVGLVFPIVALALCALVEMAYRRLGGRRHE